MTTSVKRPALLQVRSLQDNYSQLRRQRAIDEVDGLETTPFDNAREHTVDLLPASKRRPLKTHSLILPSPSSDTHSITQRSSIPSKYEDILHYYSTELMSGSDKSMTSQSNSSLSSCTSSSSISSSTSESNDIPSLILPHLYVGDQAQTQIDTLSSLNISYILSLQSLPKFLDESPLATLRESTNVNKDACSHKSEVVFDGHKSDGLLPSINSSKDYLVQIDPNSDNSRPIISTRLEQSDLRISVEGGQSVQPISPSTSKDVSQIGRCLRKKCDKFSSSVHKLIRGKCINISDTFEQLLDKFFDETHSFIEEARRNRCNVLVHCKAGISRSPTIAIAYLMKWKRLHLQEAYNFVKRCRPQIAPNLNFMGQLVSYERQLQMCERSQLHSPTCCFSDFSLKNQQEEHDSTPNQDDLR